MAEALGVPIGVVQLLMAVLVVVGAYYGGKAVTQVFGRRIARRFERPSVSRTVLRIVRTGVWLFGGLLLMNVYGANIGNIALSVTVFSAVVGVVLAPIVGSIISGLFVLADQPYEVGDMIELVDRGQVGFVEEMTIRYTKVFTLDNTFLVVPNGSMRDRDVINYSAEDPRTRVSVDVTVTYEGDLAEARELLEEAARSVDGVIEGGPDIRIGSARYPAAPVSVIDSFADHGVRLVLRCWLTDPYRIPAMKSRIQTALWERLDDADVEIAYPHSHLVFDDTSGELVVRSVDDDGSVDEVAPGGDGADGPGGDGHDHRRPGGRSVLPPGHRRRSAAGRGDLPRHRLRWNDLPKRHRRPPRYRCGISP